MAHELTIRGDGTVEMAYTGEQPWHGLGRKIAPGSSVEEWTKAAGMDWSVEKAEVSYTFGGKKTVIKDRVVLHRSDNGRALGVVGNTYQQVQPGEVIQFFGDLVQSVGLTMETAGTLFGGRYFWALARVGEEAIVDSRDLVRGYLLLSTSADGGRATTAKHTSIRVVCNNTLTFAHGKGGKEVRVSHKTKFDPEAIKQSLGVAPKSFQSFMSNMRKLADCELSEPQAELMTQELLRKPGAESRFDGIMDLFRGDAIGFDQPGFEGTAWGWLNSVTEFVDHGKRLKSDSHQLWQRLYGPGDALKTKAQEMALTLVA